MKKMHSHHRIYPLLLCLAWLLACSQNRVIPSNDTAPATPLAPTTEPVARPTDIQFLLEDTYSLGEVAALKIQNSGEVPYYFDNSNGPCNLSFFDGADHQVGHHQYHVCDSPRLAEIKPGDTTTIFNWDLSQCDLPDCVVSRPLTPGTYRLVGRFRPSAEFSADAGESIVEATIEVVAAPELPAPPPLETSSTVNTDEFETFSAFFSPLVPGEGALFFAASFYDSQGLNGTGQLYALDSQTGQPKWTYPLRESVNGLANSKNTLFITFADRLYALDGQSGQTKWLFNKTCCFSTSLAVANGLVYADHSDGIYALDAQTGQWQFRLEYLRGSIAVGQGLIYVGAVDGLYALQSQTGQQQWRLTISDALGYPEGIGSVFPVVATESIYFRGANGRLYSLDSQTGNVKWEKEMMGPLAAYPEPSSQLMRALIFPPPAVAEDIVYLANGSTLFALRSQSGETIRQFQPDDSRLSTPVIADGYLFVTSEGGLQALDSQFDQAIWQIDLAEGKISVPTVWQDQLFIASSDGIVRALNSQTGQEQWHFQVP